MMWHTIFARVDYLQYGSQSPYFDRARMCRFVSRNRVYWAELQVYWGNHTSVDGFSVRISCRAEFYRSTIPSASLAPIHLRAAWLGSHSLWHRSSHIERRIKERKIDLQMGLLVPYVHAYSWDRGVLMRSIKVLLVITFISGNLNKWINSDVDHVWRILKCRIHEIIFNFASIFESFTTSWFPHSIGLTPGLWILLRRLELSCTVYFTNKEKRMKLF